MTLAVVAALAAAFGVTGRAEPASLPRPYLMLVSFGNPALTAWAPEKLKMLDAMPFAGVASTAVAGYDTAPVPEVATFDAAVKQLRAGTKKQVWPWCFTNRFIARGTEAHTSSPKDVPEYFRRIKGWDLTGAAGAQADFLRIWRLSLALARLLDAPGVVLDLEAYNNYQTYSLAVLAKAEGLSEADAKLKLADLGRRMTGIVAEEYPGAVIWSLFLQFGETQALRYLLEGLLDEARVKGVPLRLVEGGESDVGYYNRSLEALQGRLRTRAEALAPWLARYPDSLRLGGTIAPYHDPAQLTWWIKDASTNGGKVYQNAGEFRPLFDQLFASCEYLWVYAASAAGYLPFDEKKRTVADPIHAELAALYPKWQAAYRLLSLPQAPRLLAVADRPREFKDLPVSAESWFKGDPKTDLKQNEVTLGLDRKVTKTGAPALAFRVDVDWEQPKDSKYPVGWPMIHRDFAPALDLSGYDFVEFWLHIETTAALPAVPLKYGLANGGKEPNWQLVTTRKTGEWVLVRQPLDLIGPRAAVTRLTFYIAENWYKHGDTVMFRLDGVRFLKQTTPEVRTLTANPLVAGKADPDVELVCGVAGEFTGAEFVAEFALAAKGAAVPAKTARQPVGTGRALTQRLVVAGLAPGAYVGRVRLLRNGEPVDQAETDLAVVGE